jgi:SAM-dependent methyltransferase
MADTTSEFARWEARFRAPGYTFGKEPNAFLKAQGHRLPRAGKALAVADGEGRNGVWLAQQGLDVLSIEFSPTAIAKAKKLAQERGVRLRIERVDITAWQWPREEFDVIAAIFIQFSPPPERTAVFAGIKQALKRGGLLLLEGYRPEQIKYGTGGPKEPANLYTRALLEQTFGDFSRIEISEYDSVVAEGTSHAGMSALIDLVATK